MSPELFDETIEQHRLWLESKISPVDRDMYLGEYERIMETLDYAKKAYRKHGGNVEHSKIKYMAVIALRFVLIVPFGLLMILGEKCEEICDWLDVKLPTPKR